MTIKLDIPDDVRQLAEKRAAERGNRTVDEYVADLIKADAELPLSPELEQAAIEGLDSGESIEITPDFWAKLKSRGRTGK